MKRPTFFQVLIVLPLSLSLSGAALGSQHNEHGKMMREQAAPVKEPELKTLDDLTKEIKALRQRVAALEALKPTFTNFMPNFAERFHVMHRAGDVGDWALAEHEVVEMQRLTRTSKYIDPKLGALMRGFMDGNLYELREAIEHANTKTFQAALKDTVPSCNGCHTATGSAMPVTLDVADNLSMRHPHALKKTKVPQAHKH